MEDVVFLGISTFSKGYFASTNPRLAIFRTKSLHFHRLLPLNLSTKSTVSVSKKPLKAPKIPTLDAGLPSDSHSLFQEKLLYLDSIGVDFFAVIHDHPSIISASLDDIKSIVEYIKSIGFSPLNFRRICGMCPEVLTSRITDIAPVFAFLLREVNVKYSDLRRVINRRPRLLISDVETRLRPTLYFLQSIGVTDMYRHTSLLSCSVEEKFIPRIEYLEKIGFDRHDSFSMVRRFPQLFCYSIKDNLEPKFNYFVVEMGREVKELKEFPQYFSFSLEKRIKPRHQVCVQKGVCFPLKVMLKSNDREFQNRLEVCTSSSRPLSNSLLWSAGLDEKLQHY